MIEEQTEGLLVEKLEECSQHLTETNIQFQSLYDVIKKVKNSKEREELMYVYKQSYDALGRNVKSFNSLIRVVERQAKNVKRPKEEH